MNVEWICYIFEFNLIFEFGFIGIGYMLLNEGNKIK